jgi:16S rRNA (guanine527-N7)-methyltransferase
MFTPEEEQLIVTSARSFGVYLSATELGWAATYLEELERWNSAFNLVGTTDRRTILTRHILDSMAAAPLIRKFAVRSNCENEPHIVDFGSGAGLPGVPLAIICSGLRFTLWEADRKRANFLRSTARRLPELCLAIEGSRLDLSRQASPSHPHRFNLLVSRATLSLVDLARVAQHLVSPPHRFVAFKPAAALRDPRELAAGSGKGARGNEDPRSRPPVLLGQYDYRLPGEGRTRELTAWELPDCFT